MYNFYHLNWFWWNLAWLTVSGTLPHMTTLVGLVQRGWTGQTCDLSHFWVFVLEPWSLHYILYWWIQTFTQRYIFTFVASVIVMVFVVYAPKCPYTISCPAITVCMWLLTCAEIFVMVWICRQFWQWGCHVVYTINITNTSQVHTSTWMCEAACLQWMSKAFLYSSELICRQLVHSETGNYYAAVN